jgi:hypothetical protein
MVARGIHSPAKNISGKNMTAPAAFAMRPFGASAAISTTTTVSNTTVQPAARLPHHRLFPRAKTRVRL